MAEALETRTGTPPRYEFRIWGANLAALESRLVADFGPGTHRPESTEHYIVPVGEVTSIIKLRARTLDIKSLLKVLDGLEQWCPVLRRTFPVAARTICREILARCGIENAELDRENYDEVQLLDEVIAPIEAIVAVRVVKRRRLVSTGAARADIARVTIEGRAFHTIALESEDVGPVRELIDRLDVGGYANTNYVRAIQAVRAGYTL